MSTTPQKKPGTARLLADVFDLLEKHGYERAPGRTLAASLPRLDALLAEIAAAYEGRREVPGA